MTNEPDARVKPEAPSHDEPPGVPGFRSWRAVYVFVLVAFVAMVVLFAWFKAAFNR